MGTILEAKCKCGFHSGEIMQGGGMYNHETIDMEPAYCSHCKKLVVINHKAQSSNCPYCGDLVTFYNNESLQRQQKRKVVEDGFSWGEFKLPNTTYLCPQCGKFSMSFNFAGYWD